MARSAVVVWGIVVYSIDDIDDPKLRKAVSEFADFMRSQLSYMDGASGNCVYASEDFLGLYVDYADDENDKPEIVHWFAVKGEDWDDGKPYVPVPRVPHHWWDDLHTNVYRHHAVVYHKGWFIDFTAKQFSEDAPYPLIWRSDGAAIGGPCSRTGITTAEWWDACG